jgi:hypothetical protein
MLYLIDGNNLMGRPAGPEAKRGQQRLLAELVAFLRPRKDRAIVVFDGADPEQQVPPSYLHGRLQVQWSGTGSADAVLRRRMAASGAPAALTLVSEDRELITYARARRIHALGRGGWADLLIQAAERERSQAGPIDVDDWLRFFDGKDS